MCQIQIRPSYLSRNHLINSGKAGIKKPAKTKAGLKNSYHALATFIKRLQADLQIGADIVATIFLITIGVNLHQQVFVLDILTPQSRLFSQIHLLINFYIHRLPPKYCDLKSPAGA